VLARPTHIQSTFFSEFGIVATADDTTITITSTNGDFIGFTPPFTNIVLQQGETYQVSDGIPEDDMTGTRVIADKPIAVFAGDSLTDVPDGGTPAGNPLAQEQLPVDQWGTNVVSLSFAGRLNGDTYRVLAVSNNTVITITMTNGTIVVTNQAGTFYEKTNIDGPVWFQATKPIQVAQFANGNAFDHPDTLEGDPCEILLPPAGHYLTMDTIATPDGFDENFLNLIVPQSATNSTYVDGSLVSASNFVAIGTSGYYGAQITVTNIGGHTVTSPQPVGVEVYGFGVADAYGYFGSLIK
jgi:ribosomal protein S11